jgi:alpha-L-rhamnosidase
MKKAVKAIRRGVIVAAGIFLAMVPLGSFAADAKQLTAEAGASLPTQRYDITAHGAVGDGQTLNSRAIQTAIEQCAQSGGGTVVIPPGVFLSGALFLKPGVNIELLAGAVLKGSTNINDYPQAITRIEGHFDLWRAALLNGDRVDHLRLAGPGTLDGSGPPFWREFYRRQKMNPKTTNLEVERPRLVLIQNSRDVQIVDLKFKDSGFWNLHLYRCREILVENCSFRALHGTKPDHAPSSDGVDVDSSQDITISKCLFSVGDDCIALKGSKGPFALQDLDSPPVERIHIRDSRFEAGGGIVTLGSEATIVRDVAVERCITTGPTVLRVKLRPDTQQQYENIQLRDIRMEGANAIFNISPWKQYFDLQGQPPPKSVVRNITISNVTGSGDAFGKIIGNPNTEFGDIVVKDVEVKLKETGIETKEAKGLKLKFEKVMVNDEQRGAPRPASP